jgi:hypothetical protein
MSSGKQDVVGGYTKAQLGSTGIVGELYTRDNEAMNKPGPALHNGNMRFPLSAILRGKQVIPA